MPQGAPNTFQLGRSSTHTVSAKNIIADDIWSNSINMKRTQVEVQTVETSEINLLTVKTMATIQNSRSASAGAIVNVNNSFHDGIAMGITGHVNLYNSDLTVSNGDVNITNGGALNAGIANFIGNTSDSIVHITNLHGTTSNALHLIKGHLEMDEGDFLMHLGDILMDAGNVTLSEGKINVTRTTAGELLNLTAATRDEMAFLSNVGKITVTDGDIALLSGKVEVTGATSNSFTLTENGDVLILTANGRDENIINGLTGSVSLSDGDLTLLDGKVSVYGTASNSFTLTSTGDVLDLTAVSREDNVIHGITGSILLSNGDINLSNGFISGVINGDTANSLVRTSAGDVLYMEASSSLDNIILGETGSISLNDGGININNGVLYGSAPDGQTNRLTKYNQGNLLELITSSRDDNALIAPTGSIQLQNGDIKVDSGNIQVQGTTGSSFVVSTQGEDVINITAFSRHENVIHGTTGSILLSDGDLTLSNGFISGLITGDTANSLVRTSAGDILDMTALNREDNIIHGITGSITLDNGDININSGNIVVSGDLENTFLRTNSGDVIQITADSRADNIINGTTGSILLGDGDLTLSDGKVSVTGTVSNSFTLTSAGDVLDLTATAREENVLHGITGSITLDNGDINLDNGNILVSGDSANTFLRNTTGDVFQITANSRSDNIINGTTGSILLQEGDFYLNDGQAGITGGDTANSTLTLWNTENDGKALDIQRGYLNIASRKINRVEINGVDNKQLKQTSASVPDENAPYYDVSIFGLGNNMYIRNITSAGSDHVYTFLHRISFDATGNTGFENFSISKYDTVEAQLLYRNAGSSDPWTNIHIGSTAYVTIPIHVQDLTNGEYVIQYEYSANESIIEGKDLRLLLWKLKSDSGVVGATTYYLTKRSGSNDIDYSNDLDGDMYDSITYVDNPYSGVPATPYEQDDMVVSRSVFNEHVAGFNPTVGYIPKMEFNSDHKQVRVAITHYTGSKNVLGAVPDDDLHITSKWVELSILYDSFIHADFAEITEATWNTVSF